jgi:hypothetical protein
MRNLPALVWVPLCLAFGCSDDAAPKDSSSGGMAPFAGTSGGSDSASGGAGMTGTSSAGRGAGSAGASGGNARGGSGDTSGAAAAGRGGGAGTSGAGAPGGSGAGAANASGGAGNASGGFPAAGGGFGGNASGGIPAAGSGNAAGSGAAGGCTRELLNNVTRSYFVALAAHDPTLLPLASAAKFTENGKTLELGQAGLWKTAGALKYSHSALDTDACMSATQAVVPDGSTDIPVALRLKLEGTELTEIEMIAVRQGDYSVTSDTKALAASDDDVHWEQAVATDQRNTRAELTGWMNKYYRMFPAGVCSTVSNCKRIENGGGSFSCSAGASCAAGEPGPNDNALTPRLILADVDTGIGVGFTMFQDQYTDMHMFKMYGGKVYEVSAILAKATSSGWE